LIGLAAYATRCYEYREAGLLLVPCILFAVSALLAWSELNFGTPGEQTAAGRVAGSLGYAFSPLLVSLLAAGLITRLRRVPGQPSPFRSNLNWT
jgi:hypothetical protein